MNASHFFRLLRTAARDLLKNPSIFVFPLIMLVLMILLSALGRTLAPFLTTNATNTLWLIVYGLLSVEILGCTLFGLIAVANAIVAHRKTTIDALHAGGVGILKKGTMNAGVILVMVLGYNLILWTAYLISFGIGKLLTLSVGSARILFIILLFIGLVALLMFLAFTSFFLVTSSLEEIFRKSMQLVRKEYLATLSLVILFFVLGQLIEIVTGTSTLFFKELINTLILYPYLALCMMRFVHEHASS